MKYPAIVLRDRLDDLSYEAARSRGSWEASKVISLSGVVAAGVAATVNPVMMIAAVFLFLPQELPASLGRYAEGETGIWWLLLQY